MDIAELRLKTEKELGDELLKLKRELMNLRFQQAAGDKANSNRMRTIRRSVAKIKTVFSEVKIKQKQGKANA